MKYLKVIKDSDIKPKTKVKTGKKYKRRICAYGIVFNSKNQIALVFMKNRNNHILPGGKSKPKENIRKTLKRECSEELGRTIIINKLIGQIKEERKSLGEIRFSHGYLAETRGKKKKIYFTDSEKKKGAKIIWVGLEKAISIYKKDKPFFRKGKFIQHRDLIYLLKAKELLNK